MIFFAPQKKKLLMLGMMPLHVSIAWSKTVKIYHAISKKQTSSIFNFMPKPISNSSIMSNMHAHGVSIDYNEYMPNHPWYGTGQGAGNATIWWAVLSHSLLEAYKSKSHLWTLANQSQSDHQLDTGHWHLLWWHCPHQHQHAHWTTHHCRDDRNHPNQPQPVEWAIRK